MRWLATKIGGQQKQRPKGEIPEGGPITKHRDTTISRPLASCAAAAAARGRRR